MSENDPFVIGQPGPERAVRSGIATTENLPFTGGVLVKYEPDEQGRVQRAVEFTHEGDRLDWSLYSSLDRRIHIETANGFRYLVEGKMFSGVEESKREGAPMAVYVSPHDLVSTTIGKAQRVAGDKTRKRVVKVVLPLEKVAESDQVKGQQRGIDPFKADQDLLEGLNHEAQRRAWEEANKVSQFERIGDMAWRAKRRAKKLPAAVGGKALDGVEKFQTVQTRVGLYYGEREKRKRRLVVTALGAVATGAVSWLGLKNGL